jgi:hypothetical protein
MSKDILARVDRFLSKHGNARNLNNKVKATTLRDSGFVGKYSAGSVRKLSEIEVNKPGIQFPLTVSKDEWPHVSKRLDKQGYKWNTSTSLKDWNPWNFHIDDNRKAILTTKYEKYLNWDVERLNEIEVNKPGEIRFPIKINSINYDKVIKNLKAHGYIFHNGRYNAFPKKEQIWKNNNINQTLYLNKFPEGNKVYWVNSLNEIEINNPGKVKFPLIVSKNEWPNIAAKLDRLGYKRMSGHKFVGFNPWKGLWVTNTDLVELIPANAHYDNKSIVITKFDPNKHLEEIEVNKPGISFPLKVSKDDWFRIAAKLDKQDYTWNGGQLVSEHDPWDADAEIPDEIYLVLTSNPKKVVWRRKLDEIEVNKPGIKFPILVKNLDHLEKIVPILKQKGYNYLGNPKGIEHMIINYKEYYHPDSDSDTNKPLYIVPVSDGSKMLKWIFKNKLEEIQINKPGQDDKYMQNKQEWLTLYKKHKDEIYNGGLLSWDDVENKFWEIVEQIADEKGVYIPKNALDNYYGYYATDNTDDCKILSKADRILESKYGLDFWDFKLFYQGLKKYYNKTELLSEIQVNKPKMKLVVGDQYVVRSLNGKKSYIMVYHGIQPSVPKRSDVQPTVHYRFEDVIATKANNPGNIYIPEEELSDRVTKWKDSVNEIEVNKPRKLIIGKKYVVFNTDGTKKFTCTLNNIMLSKGNGEDTNWYIFNNEWDDAGQRINITINEKDLKTRVKPYKGPINEIEVNKPGFKFPIKLKNKQELEKVLTKLKNAGYKWRTGEEIIPSDVYTTIAFNQIDTQDDPKEKLVNFDGDYLLSEGQKPAEEFRTRYGIDLTGNYNWGGDNPDSVEHYICAYPSAGLERSAKEQYIEAFYEKFCNLNPEFHDIKVNSLQDKYTLILGATSGFNFDDIKYFVENYDNNRGSLGTKMREKLKQDGLDDLEIQWVPSPKTWEIIKQKFKKPSSSPFLNEVLNAKFSRGF